MNATTLLILSGGLDSTVLAYYLADKGERLRCLSFDYGQRHRKELEYAMFTAERLRLRHHTVDLSGASHLFAASSLLGTLPMPEAHHNATEQSATIVPSRNPIMLSIAFGIEPQVSFAVHADDAIIYPDCRPEFVVAYQKMIRTAIGEHCQLLTPFLNKKKSEIIVLGKELGVPFADTWTCYKGGEIHCGRCGSCSERIDAFFLAGADDEVEYESPPCMG